MNDDINKLRSDLMAAMEQRDRIDDFIGWHSEALDNFIEDIKNNIKEIEENGK